MECSIQVKRHSFETGPDDNPAEWGCPSFGQIHAERKDDIPWQMIRMWGISHKRSKNHETLVCFPWCNVEHQRSINIYASHVMWGRWSPASFKQDLSEIIDLVWAVLDLGHVTDLCNPIETHNMSPGEASELAGRCSRCFHIWNKIWKKRPLLAMV